MGTSFESWAFPLYLCSSFFMLGLIWVVQLVHYPGFAYADVSQFSVFEAWHMSRITWIVGPMMSIELLSLAYLVFFGSFRKMYLISAIILALIWIETTFWMIPYHAELLGGFDLQQINRLVNLNWIRTVLWTVKAGLLAWILFRKLERTVG